jgi:hypothetical protein
MSEESLNHLQRAGDLLRDALKVRGAQRPDRFGDK